MKKMFFAVLLGALIAPACLNLQTVAAKPAVERVVFVEGIAVTAVPNGPDEYLITCTAPEDGPGVLRIFNATDNEVEVMQQIGIVDGQYQYAFKPKKKGRLIQYWIHFYFSGSVVTIPLQVS